MSEGRREGGKVRCEYLANAAVVCGGCLPGDESVEAFSRRGCLHSTRSCDIIDKLLLLFCAGLCKTGGREKKGKEGAMEERVGE